MRLGLDPVSDGYNELRLLVQLCTGDLARFVIHVSRAWFYIVSHNSFNFLWLSLELLLELHNTGIGILSVFNELDHLGRLPITPSLSNY